MSFGAPVARNYGRVSGNSMQRRARSASHLAVHAKKRDDDDDIEQEAGGFRLPAVVDGVLDMGASLVPVRSNSRISSDGKALLTLEPSFARRR